MPLQIPKIGIPKLTHLGIISKTISSLPTSMGSSGGNGLPPKWCGSTFALPPVKTIPSIFFRSRSRSLPFIYEGIKIGIALLNLDTAFTYLRPVEWETCLPPKLIISLVDIPIIGLFEDMIYLKLSVILNFYLTT